MNNSEDDGRRFHDMGDFDEDHSEATADEQMKHREFPSDEEIDAMALSASQEYQIAH